MVLLLIKFFLVAFAMALAWAIVVCAAAVLFEKPQRDRQLREEGYDSAIKDIFTYHQYWDREKRQYIDIEITEVKTE